ncbi:MAG: TrkA C-terminal domain-containing protein, partial [Spirochaetales bacterium]|nr:TrkA C-terminal domain-containing protein [Spirochaetales bacterium]MBQ7729812.1 TrkA C-terminal domain-containing protein [Spirochaetales bacterium]
AKDTLIAFGPLASIRDAFLLKDHGARQASRIIDSNANVITIMSNFGYQVLADIKLHRVPPMLADKSLLESKIKDYFSINIMMVSRKDKPINLTKDTVIEKGDRVIAFGPYESIHTVFGESPS